MSVQEICRVVENTQLGDGLFLMVLHAPEITAKTQCGQFVHIACGEGHLLRRPISICAWKAPELRIVFQVKGEGTAWLSQRKAGDELDVLGPLGHGFEVAALGDAPVFIGGGIGVPPMLGCVREAVKQGAKPTAILGFRSKGAVITEGVFGMKGDLGKLDEIVALKKDFQFRLLVDDAHGFGTMGEGGRGTASHFGVVDGVDVLFNTFAKSMAGIGAFVSGPRWLINLLRYNMRSQLYAKSLPMPMVIGALKRLELIRNHPEYQQKLWEIVRVLQSSLKENGFEIGVTNSPVTPVFLKGGIPEATNLVVDLRENHGIFCSMVVYPVIPKGEIILRIIPTAVHTLEDVNVTIEAFKAVRSKLQDGIYAQLPIPVRADEGFLVR